MRITIYSIACKSGQTSSIIYCKDELAKTKKLKTIKLPDREEGAYFGKVGCEWRL